MNPNRRTESLWACLLLALLCLRPVGALAAGAPPTITQPPLPRTVVQGASHPFTVTADGTAPLQLQWRRDAVNLDGQTNAALPLVNVQFADAGLYSVVITNESGAITSAPVRLTVRSTNDPAYPVPQGGWAYLLPGSAAASAPDAALDGTWNTVNSDHSWDGFGRGLGHGLPGGVDTANGLLTLEDAVSSGAGSFDNRRYFFTHNLSLEPAVANTNTLLNDGVTLTFRARLTPPTDPLIELPGSAAAPNGWANAADGKGVFGLRQLGGGGMLIGFSLHNAVEDTGAATTFNFGQAGLHMNNLNGDTRTNNVDPGEGGTLNLLPLDPTVFHEFWITLQDNGTNPGTHRVTIYLDGSNAPTTFHVTAGTGSDAPFTNYLSLALGSTGQRGAVDVDFFGYAPGAQVPPLFNQPVGLTAPPTNQIIALGQTGEFHVGVTGTPPYAIQWYRNGTALPAATNASYATPPMTAGDDATLYTVVVTNEFCAVTSAPPAVLYLLQPPHLASQPQSLTVSNGDPATFSITASSPAPITYEWLFNGTPLGGTSSASPTLLLPSAGPASAGGYSVLCSNLGGAITSAVATLTVQVLDYGDAPAPYPVLKTANGARHVITPGVSLGAIVDVEPDGQPSPAATGDDTGGLDDDDGVTFPTPLRAGQVATVAVTASTSGLLNAWLDFNNDGSWAGAGEQIFTNLALVAGTNLLNCHVAPGAAGATFARFRFNTAGGLSFDGPAADGEVEDYAVNIDPVADLAVASTDAPDPVAAGSNLTYTITLSNAGPSAATGVTLTNPLPPGALFVSATASQGGCTQADGLVTCALGSLDHGATATVTLVIAPSLTGEIAHTATVSAAVLDLNPANNTALATTTVASAPVITTPPADLTVTNGASATFTVEATGAEPLHYQWRFNTGDLAAETNASLTIANAQPVHAGSYSVRVTNFVGAADSAAATLTVLVPPSVTAHPQSRTNLAGGTANFSATATGTAPLTWQWFFNDATPLAGATNATLTLTNLQPAQAGSYRALAANSAGTALTDPALLTLLAQDFGDAPGPGHPTLLAVDGARHFIVPGLHLGARVDFEADGQPASTALGADGDDANGPDDEDGVTFLTPLLPGQTAPLAVVASTNGWLNAWLDYSRDGSWAGAGEQVFTNVVLVPGSNLLSVAVPLGATTGVTYARFRFDTTGGLTTTGEAADGEVEDYAVSIDPAIDLAVTLGRQPDPVTVGSNLVYTITVTNAGPSVATGVVLLNTLPAGVLFVSAGGSQGVCTLDDGTVTCALSSLGVQAGASVEIVATAVADGALLNSLQALAAETDLDPSNNLAGVATASFHPPVILTSPAGTTVTNGGSVTLSGTAAGTALFYQWLQDGSAVPDATNTTLTLASVQPAEAGAYTLRVTNEVGAVESDAASLTVLVPAFITGQPQSITVIEGQSATFSVTAGGTGPLDYQWQFEGTDLPGATNATLVIPDVHAERVGTYRVFVANAVRAELSAPALLTLLVPPAITFQPSSFSVYAGWYVSLTVNATGTEPLSYHWYHNGTNASGERAVLATLVYTNLQSYQNGQYFCVVTNAGGAATSAVVTLTITEADFGDAPDDLGYPTSLFFAGALHRLVAGVHLGGSADFEPDGQPDLLADGDDTGRYDDEDGVTFLTPLLLGQTASVSVTASTNGFLDAWIDFDANGSWADAGEQIFDRQPLVPGVNPLTFPVPAPAHTTGTFARFRFSTAGGLAFDGEALDGEVEDYAVAIQPAFDLAVSLLEEPSPVFTSSNLTYLITVTNRGPSTAAEVRLTNMLPAGVTFLTANASQGACTHAGSLVECTLGALPAHTAVTIALELQTAGAATLHATAHVTGTGVEVNPADNTAARTTAVITPAATYAETNLITLADATPAGPGAGVPYPSTLLVTGLTGALHQVTVTLANMTHAFPDDLDLLLVGPGGQTVLLMSDAGGSVPMVEASPTFDDAADLSLPNSGAIASQSYRPSNHGAEPDSFPAPAPAGPYGTALEIFRGTDPNGPWSLYVVDDVETETGVIAGWSLALTTVDPIADLALTLVGHPDPVGVGNDLTLTLLLTNHGPATATALTLTHVLPAPVNFISATLGGTSSTSPTNLPGGSCEHQAGTVTCTLPALAPGQGALVTVIVQLPAPGPWQSTATVRAGPLDLHPTNNFASAAGQARLVADVALAHTASTDLVVLGDDLTYTLAVTNRGLNPAPDVRLVDALPAGVTLVNLVALADPAGACVQEGGVVTCDFGTLAPGQGAALVLTVRPAAVGSLTNAATVTSGALESHPADNAATVVTPVNVLADLAVALRVTPDPVAAGSNLLCVVTVTNQGPSTASDVLVQLPLPPGVQFAGASGTPGGCVNAGGRVLCALGGLAAGQEAVVQILLVPTHLGGLTTLVAVYANSVDFDPDNNYADTHTAVAQPPTILIPPLSQTVAAGSDVTFQVGAVGDGGLGYRWQFNGVDVPDATNASLALVGVAASAAGPYRVRVSSPLGAAWSEPATLRVRVAPVIAGLDDQEVDEATATPWLACTVFDADSGVDDLILSGASSDALLVPPGAFQFGGGGGDRTVRVTPAPNRFGSAVLTLTVRDADGLAASTSFLLSVLPVNDAPVLSPLPDLAMLEDGVAVVLSLTLTDAETPGADLPLTVESSNTNLLPQAGIVVGLAELVPPGGGGG